MKRRVPRVNSSQFTTDACALHAGFTRRTYIRAIAMRPLAIIEPDVALSADLRAKLEAAGFKVECLGSATAALPRLRAHTFALAILDLDLRDTDPFAICTEASKHIPVITVVARASEEVCVRALDCGAEDCVVRTIPGRELVARIRGVLRRKAVPDEVTLDSMAVSISEMRIRVDDISHNLTRGETELLAMLVAHAPTPIPALRIAQLLGARRGTVESRIKSLRKKLGAGRLVSRGSLGYQLVIEDEGQSARPRG